jgi:DNA-binding MarR family transcriptional regulator
MFDLPTPTKSDLINYHRAEFSSGIAVINRLLNKKFLEEYPDQMDKRAKRLRITEAGKFKLFSCFEHLELLSKDIFQYLSQEEKEILYQILSRLERNHALKYEKTKPKTT